MASHHIHDINSKFDSALENRLTEIRALLRSGRTHDARVRYKIGVIVHELESEKTKYGEQVVARLAKRLGGELSASSLYDAGRVAALWSEHDFLALIEREEPEGFTLSFSHFVILNRVSGLNERMKLLELVLEARMSTAALRDHLQQAKEDAKAENDDEDDDDEDPARRTSKVWDLLRLSGAALEHHERLSISLQSIDGLNPDIKSSVDELAAAERALRVAAEKLEQQLRSLIKEDRANARAA